MIEIKSREHERKTQLLPGTEERGAALVDSLEELKAQMELANQQNEARYRRNRIIVITTVIAVGTIFLAGSKLSKIIKIIAGALSLGSFIKGVKDTGNRVIELPSSKNFSAYDRAYSYLNKINSFYNKSEFLKLVVKCTLDVMIATKMIKPIDIVAKQSQLKSNKLNISDDIRLAIIDYKSHVR